MTDLDVGTSFIDWRTDEELAHFMGMFELPRIGDRVTCAAFAEDKDTRATYRGVVMGCTHSFGMRSDGSTPIIGRCVYIRRDPK